MWRAALEQPAGANFDWNEACNDALLKRRSIDRFLVLQTCHLRVNTRLVQTPDPNSNASADNADNGNSAADVLE